MSRSQNEICSYLPRVQINTRAEALNHVCLSFSLSVCLPRALSARQSLGLLPLASGCSPSRLLSSHDSVSQSVSQPVCLSLCLVSGNTHHLDLSDANRGSLYSHLHTTSINCLGRHRVMSGSIHVVIVHVFIQPPEDIHASIKELR